MLDLLENIGHAVGTVDLHQAGLLIHRGLVPVDVKRLACDRKVSYDARLSLSADVVVPRIVPTATIQSRNVLTGGER